MIVVGATTALVLGFACLVIVTAHELFEHNEPPPIRPGNDAQWAIMADAMRRYRKHQARERRRHRG